jgi:hypothetical protein
MSSKVSNLTDIGTITSDDLLYIVDDPSGTPASRKATVAELETAIISDQHWFTTVRAASDQSISSSTVLTNDAELFFTMAANTMYEFEAVIMYSSPAGAGTPDIKFAFTGPATLTGSTVQFANCITTTDAQAGAQPGLSLGTNMTVGTAATPRLTVIRGWAYSTTGGSGSSGLIFQWAQNTSNGNATIRLAGSVLRWRVVS